MVDVDESEEESHADSVEDDESGVDGMESSGEVTTLQILSIEFGLGLKSCYLIFIISLNTYLLHGGGSVTKLSILVGYL